MNSRFCVLIAILLTAFCPSLIAGPTIIRDARITDIALTPTLGRGYTIVTNTFQSKCLDNVVYTDPSYDFQYKFESLDVSKAQQLSVAASFGLAVPLKAVTLGGGASMQTSTTSSVRKHHIFVEINMDTYYASVDEAQTRMGSTAGQLLTNNDIPGFFSSCGSYYVRSLGRNAKFISIFSYETRTETRDVKFEASLKAEIMKFGGGCSTEDVCGALGGGDPFGGDEGGEAGQGGDGGDTGGNSGGTAGAAGAGGGGGGEVSGSVSMSLAQQSDSKKLSIISRAYGLGKNEGATLISYDIETFKAAIKDAFISMQNPMTGKVTTMEIVPWVENTDFQNLIQLEKDVPDPQTGKTMLLYKKKQVLNENAEFLAEIERADRNMMNIYYKSKICKQLIEANWMKDKNNIHPDYQNAKLKNNKFPRENMELSKLITDHLNDKKIDDLLKAQETFMYGSGGANVCINKMLESGMFTISYRNIPECQQLKPKLSAVISTTVDNYCMPELVKEFNIQAADQPQPGAGAKPAGQ